MAHHYLELEPGLTAEVFVGMIDLTDSPPELAIHPMFASAIRSSSLETKLWLNPWLQEQADGHDDGGVHGHVRQAHLPFEQRDPTPLANHFVPWLASYSTHVPGPCAWNRSGDAVVAQLPREDPSWDCEAVVAEGLANEAADVAASFPVAEVAVVVESCLVLVVMPFLQAAAAAVVVEAAARKLGIVPSLPSVAHTSQQLVEAAVDLVESP